MSEVMIPRDEYEILRNKAELFDRFIETEELTDDEMKIVKKALKGPYMSKSGFLKKHPEL
jgi:hypothetical protein